MSLDALIWGRFFSFAKRAAVITAALRLDKSPEEEIEGALESETERGRQ
jgi:hypothetical protein